MKRFLSLLTSSLIAASLSQPVLAEHFTDYGDPGAGHEKEKTGMETGAQMMMGAHKMTGTVDSIDYSKGTLTLRSGAPEMRLHFPPDSIKDLKNGDTITVDLGFAR